MPDTSPLTKTPYALLADAPNIESAVPPGFNHLEKYVIPRFSTTSERNAAFNESAPSVGQMCYVSSLGAFGYLVWDGDSWTEFGDYTYLRTRTSVQEETQERTSIVAANTEMSLPVVSDARYRLEGSLLYSTHTDCSIAFNFTFPGGSSRLNVGILGKARLSEGLTANIDRMSVAAHGSRTSGDAEFLIGGAGDGNVAGAIIHGFLRSEDSGSFRVTFARNAGTSEHTVKIHNFSWISLTRVS